MAYMGMTYPDRKMCATCQYWAGEREIKIYSCNNVRVYFNGQNAKCLAFDNGQKKGYGFCCPRYRRWLEIP